MENNKEYKTTIMLVDDERDVVYYLARFLERFSIKCIKAYSGEEALELYSPDEIDFVFLDIQMTGIDGISVLAKLKEINPEVKVIMITSRDDENTLNRVNELGVLDYIVKPLDLIELKDKIQLLIAEDEK